MPHNNRCYNESNMSDFQKAFDELNAAQQKAVENIDGPLLVIAGPGTGKTQLLSVRAANILRKTDVNPENILCLTFTDSAATNMRERMIEIIGPSAYKVSVHTFHSFAGEVKNVHSDFFYEGANFRVADDLSSYEILREIFDNLPHDNILSKKFGDEYANLADTKHRISNLKKSGLTPDELHEILDHNEKFINQAEPILGPILDKGAMSAKKLPLIEDALDEIEKIPDEPMQIINYTSLKKMFMEGARLAMEQAKEAETTKPFTAWKDAWLKKDKIDGHEFKDKKNIKKLRAVADIYFQYLNKMQERQLYDYDDMVLRVTHAMEEFPELRFNLQEKYQYIMVDEFQDTSGSQMRILWSLTNNVVTGGRPNIMAVGDDDQAIFSFQGADISNIFQFRDSYRDTKIITLKENYRSVSQILDSSRAVINQATERLENMVDGVDKTLVPNHSHHEAATESHQYETVQDEYSGVIAAINEEKARGNKLKDIAVIMRGHKELKGFAAQLTAAGISFNYEKQENVLDSEPVAALINFARVIHALAENDIKTAESYLPELLSHPSFRRMDILSNDIWRLSLYAYKNHTLWFEAMEESENSFSKIAEWLRKLAGDCRHEPLELILDKLIGNCPVSLDDEKGELISPLKDYFFGENALEENPARYAEFLSSLTALRRSLREYSPDKKLYLNDFITFIHLARRAGITLSATSVFESNSDALQLMSAHKAKGLEFDVVFIMHANENRWGSKYRGKQNNISFTKNLPLDMPGNTDDERLRLLYVAMTRARNKLYLTNFKVNENEKEQLRAAYIHQLDEIPLITHEADHSDHAAAVKAEKAWFEDRLSLPQTSMKDVLAGMLSTYKLSATHLNTFIDVKGGGPQNFLVKNLLHFPEAMSPGAAFGSGIHAALRQAHRHLSKHGQKMPVDEVVAVFQNELAKNHLSDHSYDFMQKKGQHVLSEYLAENYDNFHEKQISERNFSAQNVAVGAAKLTGQIDVMEVDEAAKTIKVVDYKTGKASLRWTGSDDYEKTKLHKYKQQLMFYKLLLENSRDWSKYSVASGALAFLEPADSGKNLAPMLEINFDHDEMAEFKKLIQAVWQRIQNLDLPDISQFSKDIKGIKEFEQYLIDTM